MSLRDLPTHIHVFLTRVGFQRLPKQVQVFQEILYQSEMEYRRKLNQIIAGYMHHQVLEYEYESGHYF